LAQFLQRRQKLTKNPEYSLQRERGKKSFPISRAVAVIKFINFVHVQRMSNSNCDHTAAAAAGERAKFLRFTPSQRKIQSQDYLV
jgi:hypothetical protein